MPEWFVHQRFNPNCKLRLFLFPYAGGGASIFKNWHTRLCTDTDVVTVLPPGRENRFLEPPISSLSKLVDILAAEISALINIPYIFAGHSNGALIAFELSRRLEKERMNFQQKHIVLSAKSAPNLPSRKPNLHDAEDSIIIDELRSQKVTPNELLDDRDAMEVFLPTLRADFALSEKYVLKNQTKLKCNTSLFWGKDDVDCPKEDLLAWQDLLEGTISYTEFEGGHFFLHEQKDLFVSELNKIISMYI